MTARPQRRELKPGMKIKFVGAVDGIKDFCANSPWKAEVVRHLDIVPGAENRYEISLEWDGEQCRGHIHRRQVVSRLLPRKKPAQEERVEFYANKWKIQPICDVQAYPSRARCCAEERIAFNSAVRMVELREGERVVSRADLEKALDVSHALAKALGLEAP